MMIYKHETYEDERLKTEEHMATILSRMMEMQRQIRAAKDAEVELQKCRKQLEELAGEYVGGYDLYVVKEGLKK
ncbi:hypothetical protein [Mahella australiensis]|uniref:Uncharacterized protein n=1 Tax=Mahella australiensis (strain DSM 15567 / CIP 107919 / 50-1 BON) TaxID=697281 RepID=F4A0X3_MAHA5|nr:hypothetical protein [Mahella australiensis]AEE98050.1 hypothetical protein Mahau_2929 [Mahella australiensis 50-1 BON]